MNSYRRLPDVSGEDILKLSDSDYEAVKKDLAAKRGVCVSCGSDDWELSRGIYTHTTFSITENVHRFNRVRAYLLTHCNNCGIESTYNMYHFGLRTKGGAAIAIAAAAAAKKKQEDE